MGCHPRDLCIKTGTSAACGSTAATIRIAISIARVPGESSSSTAHFAIHGVKGCFCLCFPLGIALSDHILDVLILKRSFIWLPLEHHLRGSLV